MQAIKVFVIHVRGAKERENHIRKELGKFNIDFEFILDGNKEDITQTHLNKYFADNYKEITGGTSCTLKHILAAEKLLEQSLPYALIFEDDIFLRPNFNEVLLGILEEVKRDKLSNFILSLENTNHTYVPKKEIIEGKYLYKKPQGRCAGAYIIDYEFATNFLASIDKEKCHCIIDWYHNHLADKKLINIYWSHPHIAEQGSHNGSLESFLDNKKTGWFRKMVYFFQGKIKSFIAK